MREFGGFRRKRHMYQELGSSHLFLFCKRTSRKRIFIAFTSLKAILIHQQIFNRIPFHRIEVSSLKNHLPISPFILLYTPRTPAVTSPACPCGWHRQTPEHVIMFSRLIDNREQMFRAASTNNYQQLTETLIA